MNIIVILFIYVTHVRLSLQNQELLRHAAPIDSIQHRDMPDRVVVNIPYQRRELAILDHVRNNSTDPAEPKIYFVMPLVKLMPVNNRSECRINPLTEKAELRLTVEMWNAELKSFAMEYLKNNSYNPKEVRLVPMGNIRLVWDNADIPLTNKIKVSTNWIPYVNHDQSVPFELGMESLEYCTSLAPIEPNFFHSLRLEYTLASEQKFRKTVYLKSEHVTTGKVYAAIKNQVETDQVYLKSGDRNELVREISRNVIADTVQYREYVSDNDEISLRNWVETELRFQETTANHFSDNQWNSVFWDPTWARPDKTTRLMNRLFTQSSSEDHLILTQTGKTIIRRAGGRSDANKGENSGNFKTNLKSKAGFLSLLKGGMEIKVDESWRKLHDIQHHDTYDNLDENEVRIHMDYLNKVSREHNIESAWDGESFKIRAVSLYHTNLARILSTAQILSTTTQINRYSLIGKCNLRLPDQVINEAERVDILTRDNSDVQNKLTMKIERLEEDIRRLGQAVSLGQATLERINVSLVEGLMQSKFENAEGNIRGELATLRQTLNGKVYQRDCRICVGRYENWRCGNQINEMNGDSQISVYVGGGGSSDPLIILKLECSDNYYLHL